MSFLTSMSTSKSSMQVWIEDIITLPTFL
jgi:hypothetical protein